MTPADIKVTVEDNDLWKKNAAGREYGRLPPRMTYGTNPLFERGAIPIIPRSEWPRIIKEQEASKTNLFYLWQAWRDSLPSSVKTIKQGVLDQDGYPFCHGFSALMIYYMWRFVQGLPFIEFSASSIALPAAGWRKAGAAIEDDCEVMVKQGVAPLEYVPQLTASRSSFKAGWEQEAAKHRVTKWGEIRHRSLDEQVSVILARRFLSEGLDFMSHSMADGIVYDARPDLDVGNDNRWEIGHLNSWDVTYGVNGWGRRTGSKKYADEGYYILQVTNQ